MDECTSVIALSKTRNEQSNDKNLIEQYASSFCDEYTKHKGDSNNNNFGASYEFLAASFGSSNVYREDVAKNIVHPKTMFIKAKMHTNNILNQYHQKHIMLIHNV